MTPDWIACDWGTSNLRIWAMATDGTVLDHASSDQGMDKLTPNGFEPAFKALADPWIAGPITVMACGMVGARQGWAEAKYAKVPCPAAGTGFATATTQDPNLSVHILPGVAQDSPADVMRGEETQIAGFLSRNPGWDGIICLPGTHTKWAHISADEIVSFQTFMTGDLFAAISDHTVLRHSVRTEDWDDEAFGVAVSDAIARPERLAANLFALRADGLLHDMTPATGKARLSGLLIGAELAGSKPYWLGQQIAVIGAGALARLYVKALNLQAAPATQVQADSVTLAGLTAAYRRLKG